MPDRKNNPVIIVPYRSRASHLATFLKHYRRLLPEAYFVIVEQEESGLFNRGKLLNVGFMFSIHLSEWFIFHDVDMLVQGGAPDYSFTEEPTLFATNVSQFKYMLPFKEYFGGVTGMSREHFYMCNGYPNDFWGWGGEDNALHTTIQHVGLRIVQRPHIYYSLPHERSNAQGIDRAKLERALQVRAANENGLSTLEYYITEQVELPQGVKITVEIQTVTS